MKNLWIIILLLMSSSLPNGSQAARRRKQDGRQLLPFNRPRTTQTLITTVTVTASDTTTCFCAKLVNVTGACRRRKGILIDEPTILTFEDGMEEIESLIFQPTNATSMEATELPTFETKPPDPDDLIQSSMESSSSSRQTRSLIGKRKGRFGFFPILSLIGSINQNTQYVTFTTTSTSYFYTTTKTFFMQNCIPQPFGYPICSVRKR